MSSWSFSSYTIEKDSGLEFLCGQKYSNMTGEELLMDVEKLLIA
jgi:hypothetical protein